MRYVINQSTIWKFVGGVSAINGLVCFALSSTYDMSFGKLGFCGHLVYLLVGLIMCCLIVWGKRIPVSEKVQGVVAALIFVVICSISLVLDKLVAGKSDALSIISYGSFALMSVSMSRKFELGFETGFSTFFLQMFAAQLFKINRILLPIALVFCALIIILRHHSESGVQLASITPDSHHHIIEVGPPNTAALTEIGDKDINEESQDSAGREAVLVQSLLSRDNEQNDQEESFKAIKGKMVQFRSLIEDGNIEGLSTALSELETLEDTQEAYIDQLEAEEMLLLGKIKELYRQKFQVSSENKKLTIQNSNTEPELISAAAPGLRRRRRMTPATQSISSGMAGSPWGLGYGWIELVVIEGRDLATARVIGGAGNPYVVVHYGNLKKKTKVKMKTNNPKWSETFEFPDDGSPLLLYGKDFKIASLATSIGECVVEYQILPPNQMADKWIPLQEVKNGEIHIQITRKVPEMQERPSLDAEPSLRYLHQIPTQFKEMMVKFRSLIVDGNIEGLSTALSELETLEDTQKAHIDELEIERTLLLGKIKELS